MKLSACICTYNGLRYLPDLAESLLQQQLALDEIVVCDDGSCDGTWEWLLQWQQTNGPHIRLFKNESNLGARKNFEKAIGLATGDLLLLADQDDKWMPEKTARITAAFEQWPETEALFTNALLMDEEGNALNGSLWQAICFSQSECPPYACEDLLLYQMLNPALVTGATMAFRSNALNKALPLFTPQHYWHDYWLGVYFAARKTLRGLDENLICFREHSAQQTGTWKADPVTADLYKASYTGQWSAQVPVEVLCAHLAHARTRFQLFSGKLRQQKELRGHLRATKEQIDLRLLHAKEFMLKQIPWTERKWKMLKHWLHGGEYLRISWQDLWRI
jgi:glycosyltransferase involved in cell wall biosynthesis